MRIVSRSTQLVAERRPHSPAPSPSGHPLAPERSSDLNAYSKPPHNVPKRTLERYAFMAMGESALVRHPAPLAEPFQGLQPCSINTNRPKPRHRGSPTPRRLVV